MANRERFGVEGKKDVYKKVEKVKLVEVNKKG